MSDREWDKFFELLGKIVNEKKPVNEKTAEVKGRATGDDETNLLEFVSWDFEGEDPDEDEE